MLSLDKCVSLWYNVYIEGGDMCWIAWFLAGIVVGSVVTLRICSRLGSIEYAICEVASKSVPW